MKSPLMNWLGLVFCAVLLMAPAGRAIAEADGSDRAWLWVVPGANVGGRHLELAVDWEETGAGGAEMRFTCVLQSDFSFLRAQVYLNVVDALGAPVVSGALPLDIDAGSNTCQITLDAAALPVGEYRGTITVGHTLLLDTPSQAFILRKVSADRMLSDLEQYEEQASELNRSLGAMEAAGSAQPYLRLKTNILTDVLRMARGDAAGEAWESLSSRLRYAKDRIDSVRAGIVFGTTQPEQSLASPPVNLGEIGVSRGGFSSGGRPLFLLGGALPARDPEMLAQLRRYQFNAATLVLGAGDVREGAGPGTLQPFFESAVDHNIAVAVQLAPHDIPPGLLEQHPELRRGGQTNLAEPAARAYWEAYVRAAGPMLSGRPMLFGVSLSDDAYFHFDGEDVKTGFLDFLRANYSDRLTLNRSWRAHLASLDDITPWSTNPYDTYQQHRPYQFDWQTYHQALGHSYFRWSRDLVASALPGTPLMATLPDSVFAAGETRHGVNRERLSELLDYSGCSARSVRANEVFALDYPRESAYYTLLKSFQAERPVFNLRLELDAGADTTGELAYRYVHSALWEGAMSGLGGATVPMDSLVFQDPYMVEALATASLDLNRLAPIVHAFQTAPADVGILFSYASKVFDDGDPHLRSALNAYEGTSFGGYKVRFISEDQCEAGILDALKILVIPDTPALGEAAFREISEYVEAGGTVARTGAPIPYNERGYSRGDLIRNTGNTVLVRGLNLPTEYLHAMDAATVLGVLPQIPRPITRQGYPVEGLKSRYVEIDGEGYLYLLNLRKEPVYCTLATQVDRGRDLVGGRDVTFPTMIEPLVPMLIRLTPEHLAVTVTASAG